ncbi:MAG: ComF family protein [Cyclobacteriaceae bacterium]
MANMALYHLHNVKSLLRDFVSLVFPKVCLNCNEHLQKGVGHLCLRCRKDLPLNHHHKEKHNPLYNRFSYLPNVVFASSYMQFQKHGVAQKILNQLKYKGNYEIGVELGKWFGKELQTVSINVDCIIPIPIHKQKKRKRGYNQSLAIAEGISSQLSVPVNDFAVERIKKTSSQTNKSKLERWTNVEKIYRINDKDAIKMKNVMIVDDVITTGATVGTLCDELINQGVSEVYVICLATGIK